MVFAGKVIGFEYRKGIPNEYMESRKKVWAKILNTKLKSSNFKLHDGGKAKPRLKLFWQQTKQKILTEREAVRAAIIILRKAKLI